MVENVGDAFLGHSVYYSIFEILLLYLLINWLYIIIFSVHFSDYEISLGVFTRIQLEWGPPFPSAFIDCCNFWSANAEAANVSLIFVLLKLIVFVNIYVLLMV